MLPRKHHIHEAPVALGVPAEVEDGGGFAIELLRQIAAIPRNERPLLLQAAPQRPHASQSAIWTSRRYLTAQSSSIRALPRF